MHHLMIIGVSYLGWAFYKECRKEFTNWLLTQADQKAAENRAQDSVQ